MHVCLHAPPPHAKRACKRASRPPVPLPCPPCPCNPLQLGAFIYKYHTEVGIALPYTVVPTGAGLGGLAAAGGEQPVVLYVGASGAGVGVHAASMSPSEIHNHLTPGSSGHSVFDAPKYPGFCRKMRVGAACVGGCWGALGAGRAVAGAVARPPCRGTCRWVCWLHASTAGGAAGSPQYCAAAAEAGAWPPACPLPPPAGAQRPRAGGAAHVADRQAAQRDGRHARHAAVQYVGPAWGGRRDAGGAGACLAALGAAAGSTLPST